MSARIERKFICKPTKCSKVQFTSVSIEKTKDVFLMPRKTYISKLKKVHYKESYLDYISLTAWSSITRSDIYSSVAKLSQVMGKWKQRKFSY